MHPITRAAALGALAAAAVGHAVPAHAAPPLIYEGTLTTDGAPPDPWPALRFSIVDADGAPLWSTVIDEDGPIEIGPEGRFIAWLEAGEGDAGPLDAPRVEPGAALQVDVCIARENQPGCQWLPLEARQRIGSVPFAIRGHLPPPRREQHVLDPRLEAFGDELNPWPSTEAEAMAPASGVYLISASYSCRSTCDGPRSPTEELFINEARSVRREGGDPEDAVEVREPDNKKCNRTDGFEEKVFLPVLRHLEEGATVRFRAVGWGCVQYRYANLSLSPLSVP